MSRMGRMCTEERRQERLVSEGYREGNAARNKEVPLMDVTRYGIREMVDEVSKRKR